MPSDQCLLALWAQCMPGNADTAPDKPTPTVGVYLGLPDSTD